MPNNRRAGARTWFGRFWRTVDASRRALLNLLFLLIVLLIVFALVKSGAPPLEAKTALVLDLHGAIAEQKPGVQRPSVFNPAAGLAVQKVQLRDIRSVLEAARDDARIDRVVLVLDELDGAGMASLHEVAAALDRFRSGGKKVVAWGSSYDQRQYYLASHADEVLLHPFGNVELKGFGRYRNYYRDALDKLGVTVNLIRVGTYKSAAEPFIANAPSAAAREADTALYGALWSGYTDDVEKARKLPPGSIMRSIDELPQRMAAVGGDTAKLALSEKLVDALKTRDELRQMMVERGALDAEAKTFRQISFEEYLALQSPPRTGDAVGVIVAEGEIIDGPAPPGTVGGLSTAMLIKKAREDEHVKALVLRVNSPGGSVFGSELVRRELELARAAGKPVVVSMGDVAASGGYWISTASDEIIADPATVTGSIGVFGLLPTFDGTLEKLGVHTDGPTTTWLGGAGDPRRPLDPRWAAVMQSNIDHVYADFTQRVALARKTTPEKIDAVAQGRVWTGAQAKERGLVDRLGSYADALDSAASRAKLPKGYRVTYIEREQGRFAQAVAMFQGSVAALVGMPVEIRLGDLALPTAPVREVGRDLAGLAALVDAKRPFGALVHCLCQAP
ncbi:MAG: signal peptide peptidase SppA [Caldimonas sp.]